LKSLNNPPRKRISAARLKRARAVVERLSQIHPDPRCELVYHTEFQLLVSVVLSAQATDKSVNKAMEQVYKDGFSPQTVLDWGEKGVLKRIRSIGLAPTKAKNVYRLSQMLLENHGGRVPNDRQILESLPGVGRKTANVILGEIFGHPTLAVDTHVFRVGLRLKLHEQKTPLKAEEDLMEVIPHWALPKAHHLLILHGRYTCTARAPKCHDCALSDICPAFKKGGAVV
jgi:endonuclease III